MRVQGDRPDDRVQKREDDGARTKAEPQHSHRQEGNRRQWVEHRRQGGQQIAANAAAHGEDHQHRGNRNSDGISRQQKLQRVPDIDQQTRIHKRVDKGRARRRECRKHELVYFADTGVKLPDDDHDDQDGELAQGIDIRDTLEHRKPAFHLSRARRADLVLELRSDVDAAAGHRLIRHWAMSRLPGPGRQRSLRGFFPATARIPHRQHRCDPIGGR